MKKTFMKQSIFFIALIFFSIQLFGYAISAEANDAYFTDLSNIRLNQTSMMAGAQKTVRFYAEVPAGKSLGAYQFELLYDASKVSIVLPVVKAANSTLTGFQIINTGVAGKVIFNGAEVPAIPGPVAIAFVDVTFLGNVAGNFTFTINPVKFGFNTADQFLPTPYNLAVCVGTDTDADTYSTCQGDCDDTNAAVKPGATEVCDGIDNDCDAQTDEDVKLTFYQDADSDTYGDSAVSQQACTAPSGYVANSTDCNDGDDAIHPGAAETCNGVDDNCAGGIDEGVKLTFYQDADSDTYGNSAASQQACTAPSGYVANSTDCNDGNAAIHPGAAETCNGVDDNCAGGIDEGVKITFYQDGDSDTFGNSAVSQQACTAPSGYVANSTDCNDTNVAVHPGAAETCNGVDDNCTGGIDEGVKLTFYQDGDSDTYGNSAVSQQACTAPNGYVANSTDCNDTNVAVHPGAAELCNEVDDDCDGQTDEAVDTDGDGVNDCFDNCPSVTNAGQQDADSDGLGNACDNCVNVANVNQADLDGDLQGDACDSDKDGDNLMSDCDPDDMDSTGLGGADKDWDSDGYTNNEECNLSVPPTDPKLNTSHPERPEVIETHPEDNQTSVPDDASVVVRIQDDTWFDPESGEITVLVNGDEITNEDGWTIQQVSDDPLDFWYIFRPDDPFEFGATVDVTVNNFVDEDSISMIEYPFSFQVETADEHTAAVTWATANSTPPDETGARDVLTGTNEIAGAKIVYDKTEPVKPRFADNNNIPPLDDIADAVGFPLVMEPPTIFVNPVTVTIPCPDVDDVSTLKIYYYDSEAEAWVLACDDSGVDPGCENVQAGNDGWMVPGSRKDYNGTVPKTIEIEVWHFSAVQAANERAAGGGDNDNWWEKICFISSVL